MGWTVWVSNPGGGEIFRVVQTGPQAHRAQSVMRIGSFPQAKRLDHGANNPAPSSAKVASGWSYRPSPLYPVNFHVTQKHRAVYKNYKYRKLSTSLSRINYLSVWCLLF